MAFKRKMEVSNKSFEIIKKNNIYNKKDFFEQTHGSRKYLYDKNNNLIATTVSDLSLNIGSLNKQQFVSFIGNFNKSLYKKFIDNPSLFDLKVKYKGITKAKNRVLWKSVKVADFFYNIDLDSAYWQILHKLGYIDTYFYEEYIEREGYKQLKRLCVSFLSRSNSKIYYINGEEIKIKCDTTVLKNVYVNVRNTLHNIIQDVLNNVPCIYHNIDSVSVTPEHKKAVHRIFEKYDLEFKQTLCQKKTDVLYQFGSELRSF